MLCNFPIDAFDKRKYLPTATVGPDAEFFVLNRRTLGFSLYDPQEKIDVPKEQEIETVGDLLKGIASFYFQAEDLFLERTYDNQYRTIPINNQGVGLLEFDLPKDKQRLLIASGDTAFQKFYDNQKQLATTESSLFIHAHIVQQARGS
jgi:hypothetical protein